MKLAAIYARTNTPDSDITTQLDACFKYAYDHGYKVVELYTDVVAPSHIDDNLKKRPGLKRLIKEIKGQPGFSTLIIYDKARISRSLFDLFNIERKLSRYGISLVTSTKQHSQPPFVIYMRVGSEAQLNAETNGWR